MGSRAARKARRTFEEWKGYACYGYPQLENIEEYRVEKLLKMFEKGVLASQVEHIQRAKRYQGEVDFDQIDDNPKITKTVFHHYAALRKLTDFKDGCLVANPARVGAHFYACRHEANAKTDRTNFLTYMYKVELAQEEESYARRKAADTAGAEGGIGLSADEIELFSGLLEMADADSPQMAADIRYYLHKKDVEAVDWSPQYAAWFERLPALPGTAVTGGFPGPKGSAGGISEKTGSAGGSAGSFKSADEEVVTIRPALVQHGRLLKKGTAAG